MRLVGVGLDTLPLAQVVDCDLMAEALRHDADRVADLTWRTKDLISSFCPQMCPIIDDDLHSP